MKAIDDSGGPHVVLGLSADYHDSAAALVVGGQLVAAAQEERFSRLKHDPALPVLAMQWCLDSAGLERGALDLVAFHGKPMTTYERILRSHARAGPHAFPELLRALRSWTGRKLWAGYRVSRSVEQAGFDAPRLVFVEHHLSHAASAYFPSPFDSAAVITCDGVGEWATASISHGRGAELDLLTEVHYPHSLGLLYSAITAFCGFSVNEGESKLMGLAPYGTPRFEDVIRSELIDLRPDGSFRLGVRWFDLEGGRSMLRPKASALLGGPPRPQGSDLSQRDADLAASVQVVLDDAVLGLARRAHELTGERRACLAGGIALNCVSNGRLIARGPFDEIWIQPAAGDAGGAAGAAMWAAHVVGEQVRSVGAVGSDGMRGCALGPAYSDDEIGSWLQAVCIDHRTYDDQADLMAAAADLLAGGAIIGWFQGAMEFGPRALGNRSILADPRAQDVVGRINSQVKGREGFRPLGPAVLAERVGEIFTDAPPSPYMLITAAVRGAVASQSTEQSSGVRDLARLLGAVTSPIPACTHVDGSARLQTVDRDRFPRFHQLLTAFHERTGCPALVNTSFNLADEPIVRTPAEALATAVHGCLDALVLGSHVVPRSELERLQARLSDISRTHGAR